METLAQLESRASRLAAKMEEPVDDPADVERVLGEVSEELRSLDAGLAEISPHLAAYEVRKFTQTTSNLNKAFASLQDTLRPAKKFSFRSQKKGPAGGTSGSKPTPDQKVAPEDKPKPLVESRWGFNVTNPDGWDVVEVDPESVLAKDVSVDGLKGCTVKIVGVPGTLHATGLEGVVLLCGPVKTSVFIEDCRNCTFVVACQQLRTHATVDSDIYLRVTSRGIVEDCRGLRFAPYDLPDTDDLVRLSGLDWSVNNWRDVADFNWLSTTQPSPNWSFLPANEIKTWTL